MPNQGEQQEEFWDEFKWEEFMQEQDRKVDLYMELLTKYQDDPNRDEIIAREMGWTWLLEGGDEPEGDEEPEDDFLVDETDDEEEDGAGEEWKTAAGLSEEDNPGFEEYRNLPVFKTAHEYALRAFNISETLPERIREDSDVVDFVSNAMIAAAKIAGGVSFNDDIEMLGGSIAYCKRGLHAANRSLEALQTLGKRNIFNNDIYLSLFRDAKEMRDNIAMYILDLRERFQRGV